jgi:hypothetical protein
MMMGAVAGGRGGFRREREVKGGDATRGRQWDVSVVVAPLSK